VPEHPDDEWVLETLGRVLRAVDPVPPQVHDAALAAFAARDIDARLAHLLDEPQPVVRAANAPALVFTTDDVEIALEVIDGSVVGLVAPGAPCTGIVDAPGRGRRSFRTDELGRFSVEAPAGVLRLLLDHPSGRVRTDWFHAERR